MTKSKGFSAYEYANTSRHQIGGSPPVDRPKAEVQSRPLAYPEGKYRPLENVGGWTPTGHPGMGTAFGIPITGPDSFLD
mgnify:CR=1 FL=1